MCQTVTTYDPSHPTGILMSAPALRGYGIDVQDSDMDYPNDVCLCGIDVEAALERSGLPWEVDDCWGWTLLDHDPEGIQP